MGDRCAFFQNAVEGRIGPLCRKMHRQIGKSIRIDQTGMRCKRQVRAVQRMGEQHRDTGFGLHRPEIDEFENRYIVDIKRRTRHLTGKMKRKR